ncbi:hypothetical protein A4G18_03520 [Pasteurellaceae bacterium Pebbles2]|nr:hypothetical protein [Pasteurellaceae bacterium Pebbles2]
MDISLSAISSYALAHLAETPMTVKLHSHYAKTTNLIIANQLLALQPRNAYLSPLSLLTYYDEVPFQQLTNQWNKSNALSVELQFNLSQCQIYSSQLTPIPFSHEKVQYFATKAHSILLQSEKNGLRTLLIQQRADDFIFTAIQQILQQATLAFQHGNIQLCAHQLAKLIGVGIGLTPSGDDFLCGVLAALHKIDEKKTVLFIHLHVEISQRLMQTNDISRAFLDCALKGHFSQPVITFFDGQLNENSTFLTQLFDDIGHSSGIDTICGIYFILDLIKSTKMEG